MENLSFRISTGLKNIIGRELITDKLIAIFELVKNSYDAGATRVEIKFENLDTDNASIIISDNGSGMNEDDIRNKWLFVAYSEKNGNRSGTYRDEYTKRAYAGAKGVGRFSCDRLGSKLDLFSRKSEDEQVNLVSVDWDKFEEDTQKEFVNIPVEHKYVHLLPNNEVKGTCVVAKNLREKWDRKSLLELKKSLAKLINPYVNTNDSSDRFEIYLFCDEQKIIDEKQKDEKDRVNGQVKNYIFEALDLKTTHISVTISENGDEITTKMEDRGTFLFELKQTNKFNFLKNINIKLFYLNRSAKLSFNKYMGIHTVEFGSILVYKNGFRVMPYGESGSDAFDIDKRKQQGYNRNLGTRDLMGRISILGDNSEFVETSSRAGGFINPQAFNELAKFFKKFAHHPLERYVVNLIAWGDTSDKNPNEIMPEDIKEDIIRFVTGYEKNGSVISININPNLVDIVEERKNSGGSTDIATLKSMAKQFQNNELDKIARRVEKENKELRKDRQALATQVDKVSDTLENRETELQVTKKQALFLRGLANPRIENAVEALHSINTYADTIGKNVVALLNDTDGISDGTLKKKIEGGLFDIVNVAKKIMGTYRLALKANYDMKPKMIEVNIGDYVLEFINDILFAKDGKYINVNVVSEKKNITCNINPMELGIVIENIIHNSVKAKAKTASVIIHEAGEFVEIVFEDDGNGLNESISSPSDIFQLGLSTTGGSGVGLAHAKKIIEEMGGNIMLNTKRDSGFELKVRLKK